MIRRTTLLSCLASVSFACSAYAATPTPIPEDAVLAGDWPGIVRHLATVKSVDPVTLFIAGHALLATDRANEAMCSFAAGAPAEARTAWATWTSRFAAAHPASAVAHYFEGDALARNGAWAAAHAAFDRALALAPGNPLFLNARAIAEAGAADWRSAKADLLVAAGTQGAPRDVQTNQAVLAILHRDDPAAAGRLFDAIVKRYPNHVIGLIGQGAVAAADHHWETARGLFRKAVAVTPCVPLGLDNLLLIQQAELQETRQAAAAKLASADPGTAVYKTFANAVGLSIAGVQSNMMNTATLAGALNNSGALSSSTLQNPNTSLTNFWAAQIKNFGGSYHDLMGALGSVALGEGLAAGITTAAGGPYALAAVGAFTAAAAVQHRLDDMASQMTASTNFTHSLPPSPPQTFGGFQPAPLQNPGGVRSAPPQQAWDNGDWPVVVWPVLLYTITPAADH